MGLREAWFSQSSLLKHDRKTGVWENDPEEEVRAGKATTRK